MRNYITLNGKNSNEINGLLIQELPPISKPQIRTEVEEIDGRDGDIVTKLGFAAYDKEFTVGLYKDFDINAIIAYFNSEGTVVFSNEPDRYYNYQIIDQIDFERLVRYRTATVRMHCQPFKYSNTEGARTLGNKGTASGEGSFITLDNTSEAQFSKIEPKGNAEQAGTPTPDSPQPISVVTGENVVKIEGKNLLNISSPTRTNTRYGVTITLADDGLITLNGTATGNQWPDLIYGIESNTVAHTTTATSFAESTVVMSAKVVGGTATNTGTAGINVYCNDDSSKQMVIRYTNMGATPTATATYGIDRVFMYIPNGAVFDNYSFYLQIEKGSTATDYEPYQGQEFEVNLGKNLLDPTATLQGVWNNASNTTTCTFFTPIYNGETYTISNMDTSTWRFSAGLTTNPTNNPAGTGSQISAWQTGSSYTITAQSNGYLWVQLRKNANTAITPSDIPSDVFQIERGTTATTYAPYFTPIELAKIPNTDYEDKPVKVGDTWYIRRKVGKVVLDGSETWSIYGNGNAFWRNRSDAGRATSPTAISPIMSDYYIASSESATYNGSVPYGVSFVTNASRIVIRNKDITTIADFQTWLSTHPTTVYYALAEPVDEEITNETLISQLEALYNQAHAYKGRTHVAAIAQSGNAPHIIEAEVQRSSDGNITNNGNIVSKPTLTIYGSGNIGVSLNGYQIFEITLGDEEYITIDTAAMEAYKDTLDNLKNRLVNGDYSKFALRPGSNMIEFSGTVSKCVISKYSRWL